MGYLLEVGEAKDGSPSRPDQGSLSPSPRGGATALLLLVAALTGADEPKPLDDVLLVPLHLHVLRAADVPEIDCALTEPDLDRILAKINRVWRPAAIQFRAASLHREPAAGIDAFRNLRRLNPDRDPPLSFYRRLIPRETFTDDGLHLYYVHRLPVNGVYLGGRVAMIQESASLRAVEGGIDEPLPRVTSHEIGHALGLAHRQAQTNLMASGTTGTDLIAEEIATARAGALAIPGTTRRVPLRENSDALREREPSDRPPVSGEPPDTLVASPSGSD